MISFIVPSYNEEKDIIKCLEAINKLKYKSIEVIIVDDSTDTTPKIISNYISNKKNFYLFHRNENLDGLNGAYNLGMKKAKGELIVLLTADNIVNDNFVIKVNDYFLKGYDVIIPYSKIINKDNIYSDFHQNRQDYLYKKNNIIPNWSEGFSISQKIVNNGDLFHINKSKINGGSDITYGGELKKKYSYIHSDTLVMYHIFPDNLSEYRRQQINRGIGFSHTKYHLLNKTNLLIFCELMLKMIKRFIFFDFLLSLKIYQQSKKKYNFLSYFTHSIKTEYYISKGEIIGLIDNIKFKK